MAASRSSAVRGTRIRGTSGNASADQQAPEEVVDPREPRQVVDHSLDRRAAILSACFTAPMHACTQTA